MEQTETGVLTPTFFLAFPLIAAVAVAFFVSLRTRRARQRGTSLSWGTYVLAGFIIALLVFLAVWCGMGNINATTPVWLQCVVTLGIVGSLIPLRETLHNGIGELEARFLPKGGLPAALRLLRDAAAILVAAELARNALEVPWNDLLRTLTSQDVLVEYAIVALAMATTYFIGMRAAVGPVLVTIVCAVFGIAQDFVIRFKGTAILPMDLLALGTAAEVAGQYTLTLNDTDISGITYAAWAIFFLGFLRPALPKTKERWVTFATANVMLALVCGLALDWWFEVPDYREDLGYDIFYWWSSDSYREQGFMPSFLTAAGDLVIKVPDGYSTERAQQILTSYAAKADAMPERAARRKVTQPQFDQTKPSVIVVMNETFSDLSIFDNIRSNYTGPKFFNSINDALAKGKAYVSVFGGGTCNSEFEFLTGNSMAFVGSGKYPYQMYRFEKVANLARQLSELGYQTTAMHPNAATNWHRDVVYDQMGFDQFVDITAFSDAPRLHMGVTDRATYDKVLEILRTNDEPQFVFDVTMQNHGGYTTDDIPEELMTNYLPDGFDEGEQHELNVYLSCIQAADEDLRYFVGELRKLPRPVVLVFFGDHQPGFSNKFNDRFFTTEDVESLEHQQRLYETVYAIWANYDVAGVRQNSPWINTSGEFLAARTLDLVGAPLSDFQKAQIVTHERIPIINALGYQGTDGRWFHPGDAPYLDATYNDMEKIEYLTFGSLFE